MYIYIYTYRVSPTRRSSGVALRSFVRVYASVLVSPNLYIHTYIPPPNRWAAAPSATIPAGPQRRRPQRARWAPKAEVLVFTAAPPLFTAAPLVFTAAPPVFTAAPPPEQHRAIPRGAGGLWGGRCRWQRQSVWQRARCSHPLRRALVV